MTSSKTEKVNKVNYPLGVFLRREHLCGGLLKAIHAAIALFYCHFSCKQLNLCITPALVVEMKLYQLRVGQYREALSDGLKNEFNARRAAHYLSQRRDAKRDI